jgi:hypothetical protein
MAMICVARRCQPWQSAAHFVENPLLVVAVAEFLLR